MLIPVLVVADSSSSQRGLAALVQQCEDFQVFDRRDWKAPRGGEFSLLLGEIADPGSVQLESLVEPFVLLGDQLSLAPAPGRALLAGDASDEVIWCAMRAVLLGLSVTDGPYQGSPPSSDLHPLTTRELEILGLLGEGYTNRQMAEILTISENTVKFHLSSIFSKLEVGSRAEAVSVGLRNGLIML